MKRNKKGFTLIELLIVIAIIAILIAIAIPTFAAQLNKANLAVDAANLRAATSLAVADYMLTEQSGSVEYYAIEAGEAGSDMKIVTSEALEALTDATQIAPKSSSNTGNIKVTVKNGEVTSATWSTVAP